MKKLYMCFPKVKRASSPNPGWTVAVNTDGKIVKTDFASKAQMMEYVASLKSSGYVKEYFYL